MVANLELPESILYVGRQRASHQFVLEGAQWEQSSHGHSSDRPKVLLRCNGRGGGKGLIQLRRFATGTAASNSFGFPGLKGPHGNATETQHRYKGRPFVGGRHGSAGSKLTCYLRVVQSLSSREIHRALDWYEHFKSVVPWDDTSPVTGSYCPRSPPCC